MPTSDTPLRVNLQMLYSWSRFQHDYCQLCKGPVGYGALAEVYTPRVEPGNYQTEAEAFQAADDYCNALADQQEAGQFTLYAMYPVCDECASRMIIEDVSDFAAPLLSTVRAEPREHLWMAVCLQYEPGAYGRYQPFLIHSSIPTPVEQIYARARQSYLSDEPRFEAYPYPIIDETHHHTQRTRRRPTANVSSSHRKKRHKTPRREK